MTRTCRAPVWQPTKGNPDGGHGQPATLAMPLGDTGRWLPLCPEHAARHPQPSRLVPVDSLEEL